MRHLIYTLILKIPFTIDRIEGSWVIVEWANMALTTVCEDHFPSPPKEGQKGHVKIWMCNKSNGNIINQDPIMIQEKGSTSVIPYTLKKLDSAHVCFEFNHNGKNIDNLHQ